MSCFNPPSVSESVVTNDWNEVNDDDDVCVCV